MRKVYYTAIYYSADEFDAKMNEFLNDGYSVLGNLVITHIDEETVMFAQGIVKEVPE